jgi:hypothetical protein
MKLPTLSHETRRSMAEDLLSFALGVEHYLHGPHGQRKSADSLSPIEQAAESLVMVAKMTAVRLDPARMSTVRTADDAADSSFLTCTVCQENQLQFLAIRRVARRVHIKIRGSTDATEEDWFFLSESAWKDFRKHLRHSGPPGNPLPAFLTISVENKEQLELARKVFRYAGYWGGIRNR